jgi:hypothetical protein
MSNSKSQMDYQPLKNISKSDQTQYYPSILKIGKDQKELENLLSQYKNIYQEFITTAKNINSSSQWVVERNVMIDNFESVNIINNSFAPDITQDECITECLNNPHCDYILFSDSGNGACAANHCVQISKKASLSNNISAKNIGSLSSENNLESNFKGITVNNPGCEYNNSGPTSSTYNYNSWIKPTWTDVPGATFTTKHALGGASSLDECKTMALNKGPHSLVEFTGAASEPMIGSQPTNCYYATAVDNNLRINNLDGEMTSNMVSLASQNTSDNMQALDGLVASLDKLNGDINNKLHDLEKQDRHISKKNLDYESRLNFKNINYGTAYNKLNNDRKVLNKLYEQNNTQNKVNRDIQQNLKMKKSRYWFLEFLI